tara:strand:- start:2191 stop:2766 length:576 start_codon:yes stop_codon:yes gene_type:complete
MLNIILFGPPGSGKGTQAEKLVDTFELMHISTGDLLRSEIANKTKLGLEAKEFMNQGKLVPDSVVIGMIEEKLKNNRDVKGIIFDGFPRTEAQAEALDVLLEKYKTDINAVLSLEVSEEELKERLLLRGKTSGRADDQDVSIIEKRIREYREKTEAVGVYYDKKGAYVPIKGEGDIESIFQSLCDAITRQV